MSDFVSDPTAAIRREPVVNACFEECVSSVNGGCHACAVFMRGWASDVLSRETRVTAPPSLSGVDLNLLVALDALLTERNVTRAAERVSVGQSAMSASLARLRDKFQDPLLVREGRGYSLSIMAQSLIVPVRTAVAAVNAVLGSTPLFDPTVDERSFLIVASEYVSLVLLRPLLAELAAEAPNVRINVAAIGPANEDRVRRGGADLLIYPTELAGNPADLRRETLFDDKFVLVTDLANPDITGEIDLERFTTLPFLVVTGPMQSLVTNQLAAHGITMNVQVTTQNFATAPLLIAGTRLVTLVQERLAVHMKQYGNLRVLPSPVPLRGPSEAMYWSHQNTQDPGHRWLRQRLAAQARAM